MSLTVAPTFAETHAWLWLEVKTTMEWNSNMDDGNTTSVDMHVSRAGSMHETQRGGHAEFMIIIIIIIIYLLMIYKFKCSSNNYSKRILVHHSWTYL